VARVLLSPATLVALVVLAALTRIAVYVADHSLTTDEAFIALNVERRSAARLAGELDWNQAAPLAFLEIQNGVTGVFGGSEYALRFAPFIASLLAVALFARLANIVVEDSAALLAVLVFTGIALVTSYAAVAKPYSFDVLITLALYLSTLGVLRDEKSSSIATLTMMGAIAPLFSYASFFVIAASVTVLAIDAVVSRRRRNFIAVFIIAGTWLMLLLIFYVLHASTMSHIRRSLPHETLTSLGSLRDTAGSLRLVLGVSPHSNNLGYGSGLGSTFATAAAACAALFIILGALRLVRSQWRTGALLLLPGIYALVASAAGWYPVLPRAILFLGPTLAIIIAAGFYELFRRSKSLAARAVVIGMFVILIVSEVASSVSGMAAVRRDEGMKPVINMLAEQQEHRDTVYLDFASQYAFAHYLQCRCAGSRVTRATRERLWDVAPVPGSPDQWAPALKPLTHRFRIGKFRGYDLDGYYADFAHFPRHGRVWVVFSGLRSEQRQTLAAWLDRRGKRLAGYHESGDVTTFSVLLYEF
jgi:4-amino-4-deoxy-L-arabinose transferase-like glycosyltransferase